PGHHRELHSFPTRRSSDLELEIAVKNALTLRRALGENLRLREELADRHGVDGLIGAAPAFRRVVEAAAEAAVSRVNVLLTGESGDRKSTRLNSSHDQISYA